MARPGERRGSAPRQRAAHQDVRDAHEGAVHQVQRVLAAEPEACASGACEQEARRGACARGSARTGSAAPLATLQSVETSMAFRRRQRREALSADESCARCALGCVPRGVPPMARCSPVWGRSDRAAACLPAAPGVDERGWRPRGLRPGLSACLPCGRSRATPSEMQRRARRPPPTPSFQAPARSAPVNSTVLVHQHRITASHRA